MKTKIFNYLIENAEIESGSELDTVGLSSKFNNYEFSFYGENIDGYNLIVEDFGKMTKDGWKQETPNDFELSEMKKLLLESVKKVKKQNEMEKLREEEMQLDDYDEREHGVYAWGY